MEDEKIVDLYLERDESAIARTSEKYGMRLRRIADNILNDMESARECENDSYMTAWNSIPPNTPHTYFYAFMARIARHISLDLCRKRSRVKRSASLVELTYEMEQCIPAPDDVHGRVEEKELARAISTFLRTLPEKKRDMFVRRYWYLDSVPDMAERFSMSEGGIKATLFRCRNELRKFLIKEGYEL